MPAPHPRPPEGLPGRRDACNESLRRWSDPKARHLRGWIYLKMEAAQPAWDDFAAVLQENARHADALSGRGGGASAAR